MTLDLMPQDRLSRINDALKQGDDLVRDMRDHLVDRPTDVFLSGFAMDVAQSLVDANKPVVRVRNTQPNWSPFIKMGQLQHLTGHLIHVLNHAVDLPVQFVWSAPGAGHVATTKRRPLHSEATQHLNSVKNLSVKNLIDRVPSLTSAMPRTSGPTTALESVPRAISEPA